VFRFHLRVYCPRFLRSHSLIEKCADSENWLDDVTSGAESVIVQDDASNESSHQRGQTSGESGGP
jgi:hypothetical protein